MIKYILFSILLIAGCAQVTSLNLKKHQFGKIPTQIVWIQVAGLAPEHIAFLKYSSPSVNTRTAFENALCVGQTWEYNLFDLRPSSASGFLGQLTGKKNIKESCTDYELRPIWSYLDEQGYNIGIFEGESLEKQSLLNSKSCKQENDFLANTVFWKMQKPQSKDLFHANEAKKYRPNNVYYDKSCSRGECFTTLSRNIEETFKSFSRSSKNFLYIVRNFQYEKFLKTKQISKAKAELSEINNILNYFQKLSQKNTDMLILLTSAAPLEIDFPRGGREWQSYEKRGLNLKTKKSSLLSSLYVNGARAENFCGLYDQSDILRRIFSGAKQQGLEFSIINPFE